MSEWHFTYEVPVGQRCHKTGWAITTYGDKCWYIKEDKKWHHTTKGNCSTHTRCRTFKAFKRHLRKHPELQGQEVILVSRFRNLDITAKWKKKL